MPPTDTLVTLRDYFEKMLEEREKRFQEYKTAQAAALELAAESTERWLDKLNDLRGTVVQTAEFRTEFKSMDGRVKLLEGWRNRLLGVGMMIGLISGLVGALIMRILSGLFK